MRNTYEKKIKSISPVLLVVLVVSIFVLVFSLMFGKYNKGATKIQGSKASSENNVLDSRDDWLLGTGSNASINNQNYTGDSLYIDDKNPISQTHHDLNSGDVSILGNEPCTGNGEDVIDESLGTGWRFEYTCTTVNHVGFTPYWYWRVNLSEDIGVKKVEAYFGPNSPYVNPTPATLQISDDGENWTSIITYTYPTNYTVTQTILDNVATSRYWRMRIGAPTCQVGQTLSMGLWDLKLYPPDSATATHLSAPTQITNTNLYQWQTFTPTYTKPANTNISFRFRTSTDASTWTSWSAPQTPASGSAFDISSLVTSKTGDVGSETFYKYIQVETTLTSTDGVSTPTLSDYTINYHTNVPPSAPTGLTAVVGS